jgi:hypothetical protein
MPKTFKDVNTRVTREQVGNKFFVQYINRDTGEVMDSHWEEHAKAPRGKPTPEGRKPYFIKWYRTNWQGIVRSRMLTPYEAGIYSMMVAFLDWESCFVIHPDTNKPFNESSFASFLGMSQSQMHETVHSLRQKGLISRLQGKDGLPANLLINPNVSFWGSRMKDTRHQQHFTGETCEYKPQVTVKYRPVETKEPTGEDE